MLILRVTAKSLLVWLISEAGARAAVLINVRNAHSWFLWRTREKLCCLPDYTRKTALRQVGRLLAEGNKIYDFSSLSKLLFSYERKSRSRWLLVSVYELSDVRAYIPEVLVAFPSVSQNSYRNSYPYAPSQGKKKEVEVGSKQFQQILSTPSGWASPVLISHWLRLCLWPHLAAKEAGNLCI